VFVGFHVPHGLMLFDPTNNLFRCTTWKWQCYTEFLELRFWRAEVDI